MECWAQINDSELQDYNDGTAMPRCQSVALVLFLFRFWGCHGYFSLHKSPFGSARMSCGLQSIKEVRLGSPSCVALKRFN